MDLDTMDFPFSSNDRCETTDVFYQRARSENVQISGLERLATGSDREKFIALLRKHGRALSERIGLPFVQTPPEVHDVTMGTQPSGDFFFCDMLSSLYEMRPGNRILDFGCSTGRVIRNLKAAYPHINAFGCDPRRSSIEFIAPLIPNVSWFVSPEAPPLELKAGSFDMVFAISVWSHFSERRALAWFEEMARVIAPGGELIFSTHGERSIYHFLKVKKVMPDELAKERMTALSKGQIHFMPYGSATDLDEHWGMAFVPQAWISTKLSGQWVIKRFEPGLAMANQDVYVLVRR